MFERLRASRWSWVASSVLLGAVLIGLIATAPVDPDRAEEIGSLIRCPVCSGVPINESPSPMARDMMQVLRESLDAGATRDEAIATVIGAYPGSNLLDPSFSPSTAALWLIPLVALLTGVGLFSTVRRSRSDVDLEAERVELERRRDDVERDLRDLRSQAATGDIAPEAIARLRRGYETELTDVAAALMTVAPMEPVEPKPRSRTVTAVAFVVVTLGAIVAIAGSFIAERPDTGLASGLNADPDSFSNETLAAVIAENEDNPLIDGMRLALAERYFVDGSYQEAFPLFLAVAESDLATDSQAATSLTRLGWMAFDGNGEVEAALELMGRAGELVPADPFPLYLSAVVRWCGQGDADAAVSTFDQLLARDGLDPAITTQIESDRAAAAAGEACAR